MGTVQGLNRNQIFMPSSLDESIAADNQVRVLDALVDSLDLRKLGFPEPSAIGRPSYAANDLLKLYLYGYLHGIRSSRKLEAELLRNVELIWMLRRLKPDHKTIADFRRKNPKPFQKAFREFVAILDGWGLLGKEVFAIDGTKIKASNNKKLNFSKKKLADRIARIDEKITSFVAELEKNDNAEETTAQRVNVEEALASLKERKEEYEAYLSLLERAGENEISKVDPDSRLMGNNRGGVDVCYNVQSAVDAKHCLAVEVNVTNNPSDHGQLSVMSKRVKKRLKIKRSFTVLADKGYYNGEDLLRCKKNKIVTIVARQKVGREAPDKEYNADKFTYVENKDCYLCPLGQVLERTGTKESRVYQNKKACEECPERAKCTTGSFKRLSISHYQKIFTATDKRLLENLQLYRRRQMIVEHPLGTIKRSMNGYYFLLRTIKKVRGEVALLFFAYNLKRVQNILGQKELMKRLAALLLCLYFGKAKTVARLHLLASEGSQNTHSKSSEGY